MSPKRIQRKRTKGWRMPEDAIYVGRPSKWGNPWRAGHFRFLTGPRQGELMNALDAVAAFRNSIARDPVVQEWIVTELRGKDLACWCPLDDGHGNRVPCHADVLLELANPGWTP